MPKFTRFADNVCSTSGIHCLVATDLAEHFFDIKNTRGGSHAEVTALEFTKDNSCRNLLCKIKLGGFVFVHAARNPGI